MAERAIGGAGFADDDGSADPRVTRALAGYATGADEHDEYAVLAVLAEARLLVPVVPALTEQEKTADGLRRDKRSEMALPTLLGEDGRRAVPAFTSAADLVRWRADARPVPVPARQACRAALEERADAVVVDVAGPVPYVIDGDRLRVLAGGGVIGGPHEDPVVLAAVHAATRRVPGVTAVRVRAGKRARLAVGIRLAGSAEPVAALHAAADGLRAELPGSLTVELALEPASAGP